MTTDTSAAATLFQDLLHSIGADALTGGVGLLNAFFTNIKANPSTQSVIAQAAILVASAPLQLPNLENVVIGQIADTGLALTKLISTPAS